MKKMLPWLVSIVLSIILIAIVAVIAFNYMFDDKDGNKEPKPEVKVETLSAKERVEVTSVLTEYRRNLKDQNYVVILSFAFQLDSKKTKEEFDQILDLEIKPVISRTLADTTASELQGSQGEDALETKLLNLLNPILPKGKMIKVEITDIIITEL
ncbi:flagellar basal body protein FliL [Paenibacillus oryzae]|uniref:Flagellar protein FliL n=1 Tax=Paenibacillus oryzae TaxID=1844972 RepID=A0A1A5YN01_9BACL|nr:flagellar basal body-associated FliL family protein [Paenibacillus oryzae]OBR66785.1 flagellar basal body protein FliL [Paenibacillus oryzae]